MMRTTVKKFFTHCLLNLLGPAFSFLPSSAGQRIKLVVCCGQLYARAAAKRLRPEGGCRVTVLGGAAAGLHFLCFFTDIVKKAQDAFVAVVFVIYVDELQS